MIFRDDAVADLAAPLKGICPGRGDLNIILDDPVIDPVQRLAALPDDEIIAGDGTNYVVAGQFADSVGTGNGEDYVLGDNGQLIFDATGLLNIMRSTATSAFRVT